MGTVFIIIALLMVAGLFLVLGGLYPATLVIGIIIICVAITLIICKIYKAVQKINLAIQVRETIEKCRALTIDISTIDAEEFYKKLDGISLSYKHERSETYNNIVNRSIKFHNDAFDNTGTYPSQFLYDSIISIEVATENVLKYAIVYKTWHSDTCVVQFDNDFYSEAFEFCRIIKTICALNKVKAKEEEARLKAQMEQAREEKKKFLAAPEPVSYQHNLSGHAEYTNEAEREINRKFAAFVAAENDRIKLSDHVDWLNKRKSAQTELDLLDERRITENEIVETTRALEECIKRKNTLLAGGAELFDSIYLSAVIKKFNTVCRPLKKTCFDNIITEFFKSIPVGYLECTTGQIFIFHLFHLSIYNRADHTIRYVDYNDLSLQAEFYKDETSSPKKSDEIVGQHYQYETKNGEADKRYGYNPITFDVMRGKLVVTIEGLMGTIDFNNKEKTLQYEKAFQNYCQTLCSPPYSEIKSLYLSNSEKLKSIDELFPTAPQAPKVKREYRSGSLSERSPSNSTPARQVARTVIKTPMREEIPQSLSDLSLEEQAMIIAARRQQSEKAKEEKEAAERMARQAKLNFAGVNPIEQSGGNRVITNNLFNFTYKQVADTPSAEKYELVFVDELGNAVSNTQILDKKSIGTETKISFKLNASISFDSFKPYYLLVRPAERTTDELLGKLTYKINISFTDEFGF